MRTCQIQSIPGQHAPAYFRRECCSWIVTTLTAFASMLALSTPAGAWTLGAQAKLYNGLHQEVGVARLAQLSGGNVYVQVHVHDLPAGFHGFHVHAIGECVPPFASAGPHFDRGGHTHGRHSGDFPVLLVEQDGTANAVFSTDRFEVADLFDGDGSAIIIHADPDNYANIPGRYAAAPDATTLAAGDSGNRIACGVVRKLIER
jgi:Cu-Zn family superoxide dismutase